MTRDCLTSTAPTIGLGDVSPDALRASRSASRMNRIADIQFPLDGRSLAWHGDGILALRIRR